MMDSSLTFKEVIITECKKQTLEETKKDRGESVILTDGSKLDTGKIRVAVFWKDKKLGQ